MAEALITEGAESTPGLKSRSPIGMLMLDDPYSPDLIAHSPYLVTSIVEGCTPDRLVYEADTALEEPMVAAARSLVAQGARAITGNCGYMMRHQVAVRNAVDVPVFLSSLLLAPMLLACLGDSQKLGIIAANVPTLSDELLQEAGVLDSGRIVMGNLGDKPALKSAFLDCNAVPDISAIEQETVDVSRELVAANPDVGLILLECTALPDFAAIVQGAVHVPVLDIVSLVELFVQGFSPARVRSLM